MICSPWTTLKNVGTAIWHYDETAVAMWNSFTENLKTNRGIGKIVGDILQTFIGTKAAAVAKEINLVGKTINRIKKAGGAVKKALTKTDDLRKIRVGLDGNPLPDGLPKDIPDVDGVIGGVKKPKKKWKKASSEYIQKTGTEFEKRGGTRQKFWENEYAKNRETRRVRETGLEPARPFGH